MTCCCICNASLRSARPSTSGWRNYRVPRIPSVDCAATCTSWASPARCWTVAVRWAAPTTRLDARWWPTEPAPVPPSISSRPNRSAGPRSGRRKRALSPRDSTQVRLFASMTVQDPLAEAQRLAAEFRADAPERDHAAGTPKKQRDQLRASGLLQLCVITPHLIGTPAQRDHWYAETARRGLFWGNSLNPLDLRTNLARNNGDTIHLNGEKSFCTGAADSDVLLVSANWPGESRLQVAVLQTTSEGITVRDDWDNM